jgi:hypothetical protein
MRFVQGFRPTLKKKTILLGLTQSPKSLLS